MTKKTLSLLATSMYHAQPIDQNSQAYEQWQRDVYAICHVAQLVGPKQFNTAQFMDRCQNLDRAMEGQ